MKKPGSKKSRDTVPLRQKTIARKLLMCKPENAFFNSCIVQDMHETGQFKDFYPIGN
jgi:hypothetical protein